MCVHIIYKLPTIVQIKKGPLLKYWCFFFCVGQKYTITFGFVFLFSPLWCIRQLDIFYGFLIFHLISTFSSLENDIKPFRVRKNGLILFFHCSLTIFKKKKNTKTFCCLCISKRKIYISKKALNLWKYLTQQRWIPVL